MAQTQQDQSRLTALDNQLRLVVKEKQSIQDDIEENQRLMAAVLVGLVHNRLRENKTPTPSAEERLAGERRKMVMRSLIPLLQERYETLLGKITTLNEQHQALLAQRQDIDPTAQATPDDIETYLQEAPRSLTIPVTGTFARRFVSEDSNQNDVDGVFKGIVIETRLDVPVFSPVDGIVIYVGALNFYGKTLIIRAGKGYHVLLAGMERVKVQTNQRVLSGEPVGFTGVAGRRFDSKFSGKNEGQSQSHKNHDATDNRTMLYFEFRKDGTPIDPVPWFTTGTSPPLS
ncbi:MAG: peptidoglycan DD-metalloendopeptidase family protein [Parvularculales bacterium]